MCCRTACHVAERRQACTHLDLSELHRLPGPVVINCFWSIHCSTFASMSLWPQATPRLGLVQLMLLELTLTSGGGATTFSSTGSPTSLEASASVSPSSASLASSKASHLTRHYRHPTASCASWNRSEPVADYPSEISPADHTVCLRVSARRATLRAV